VPTGSSAARDAGLSCLVHNRWIALDFCFPGLLFLRSPGVTLKPSQISSIFAGNPLKLIWQLCEVELIADQIRGADGANGWMGCQGIIQSAGSQWDGTFYLALSEGSESAPAGQSDSAAVTRPTNQIPPRSPGQSDSAAVTRPIGFHRGHQANQIPPRSPGRPIRFSRPLKGLLEYHHEMSLDDSHLLPPIFSSSTSCGSQTLLDTPFCSFKLLLFNFYIWFNIVIVVMG